MVEPYSSSLRRAPTDGAASRSPIAAAYGGRKRWAAVLVAVAAALCFMGRTSFADTLEQGKFFEIQNKEVSKRHDCFLIQESYGGKAGAHSWDDRPHEAGYNRESYRWFVSFVPPENGGDGESDIYLQNGATWHYLTQIDSNEWDVDTTAEPSRGSIWTVSLSADGRHYRFRNKKSTFLLAQKSYGQEWDVNTWNENTGHDSFEWFAHEVIPDLPAEPIEVGANYRVSNKELSKRHDSFLIQGNYGEGSLAAHSWCEIPGESHYDSDACEWEFLLHEMEDGTEEYVIVNAKTGGALSQTDPNSWDVDVVPTQAIREQSGTFGIYEQLPGAIWFVELDARGTHYRITNKQSGFGLIQADYGWEWDVHTWDRNTGSDAYLWAIRKPETIPTVTILSVRCINPSTGKDFGTKLLFQAVDAAVEMGAGALTGGGSVAASASARASREAAKAALKTAVKGGQYRAAAQATGTLARQALTKQALKKEMQDYAEDKAKEAALAAGNAVAGDTAESFSELLFDQVYGTSPDALYVRVNHIKRWPSGDGHSVKSQDEVALNMAIPYDPRTGFVIELMEYDSGSGDDSLGWAYWNPEVIERVMQRENQEDFIVIKSDSEKSVYQIKIRVGMGFPE